MLVREATLAEYKHNKDFARQWSKHPPLDSLWKEARYEGRRWGMAIDLSKCIGCGACVVACQAENNIPIVGKEQVLRGREMHWIRIDRYFRGDPDEAAGGASAGGLPCIARMAPCEEVCPVAATVHSSEGLNDDDLQPLRRHAVLLEQLPLQGAAVQLLQLSQGPGRHQPTKSLKMHYNPEVTVRSRGVMEKCTYCIQRIQHAKIAAKNQRRPHRPTARFAPPASRPARRRRSSSAIWPISRAPVARSAAADRGLRCWPS